MQRSGRFGFMSRRVVWTRPAVLFAGILLFASALSYARADDEVDPGDAGAYVNRLVELTRDIFTRPDKDGIAGQGDGGGEGTVAANRVSRAALLGMLRDNLDVDRMSRVMVGEWWRDMTEGERQRYQRVFAEYITEKYATFLSGYEYDGETFEVTGTRRAGSRDALVETSLSKDGAPWVVVEWRITSRDGRLYVLDVKVEKVSLARTERDQIQTLLQQGGVDGLITALEAQLAHFRRVGEQAAQYE